MKRLLSFSIFLVIAITVWWSTTENLDDNKAQQKTGKHYIEIYMNEFALTAMDENGKPGYTLSGSYLEKFNDSEDTEIRQPVFHLLQQGKQWKISAESAILNDKHETIQLTDNVIMQQQNIEPAATIRTQSLLIHTKSQIAQTRAPVEITRGRSSMKSTGMVYNNLTSELDLSADVNGYYLPDE